jgi:hypothetical protein
MLSHTTHGFAEAVAQATPAGWPRISPARLATKFTPNCVLDLRNVRPVASHAPNALLHHFKVAVRRWWQLDGDFIARAYWSGCGHDTHHAGLSQELSFRRTTKNG